MLNPYARGGQYERFFEGRNNVDFANDFVVIENEELKRRPDLHAVVNILLLHQITGEMYLTRNRQARCCSSTSSSSSSVTSEPTIRSRPRWSRKPHGAPASTAARSAPQRRAPTTTTARRRWKRRFNCSDWVFLLRQKPESIETAGPQGASCRWTRPRSAC